MRLLIGVGSALAGWALWLKLGGALGFIVGALVLAALYFAGVTVWQRLRKRGHAQDLGKRPYLFGWCLTAGMLLVLAAVVTLMGRQLEAEQAFVQQGGGAALQGYPGESVLEFGVLLAGAGLATLVAGATRWLEHRRFRQGDTHLAGT